MFKFFTLLKRFIPPYKKYVVLNLVYNLLATIFSLFSFATIIPILQILFGIQRANVSYQPWSWNDSLKDIFNALKNNAFYSIEQIVEMSGASTALLYLGLFLIVITFLKTGTAYLASYYMVPIRTGVVRDLRNQLYRKILNLPIGFFTEERKGDIISRMTNDVNEVEASIISSLEML
ncbi:MAG TPA: ABC transporter transmembrane domain-containing protein, partial [Paludibacteraceae bacterium]|nr:ABC transporter transmembrane domain-containing protein [Paludibacteraceae bacterium]